MDSPDVSRPRREQVAPKILVPILISILGCPGGVIFADLVNAGIFEWWHSLGSPPEPVIRIVNASIDDVYVETVNGLTYVCGYARSARGCQWRLTERPQQADATQVGGRSSLLVASPPGKVIDSREIIYPYFETVTQTNYAVLSDGSVWIWSHSRDAYNDQASQFGWGVIGVLAGLLIGTVISARMRLDGPREG